MEGRERGKVPSCTPHTDGTERYGCGRRGSGTMTDPRRETIEITVNGRWHDIAADPETPLLYILRNDLRLNSVRFGCGIARCGACAVLLDGVPVRSCAVPVGDVA